MPDAIIERDGHVMIITMNRPQRMNAISGAMLIRMFDAYEEASNDPDIRCIVVTGADGNFCAGADLRAMAGDAEKDDPLDTRARMAEDQTSSTKPSSAITAPRNRSSRQSREQLLPAAPRSCKQWRSGWQVSRPGLE